MSQKGAKIDAKIHPKFKKETKGEPRGRQQSQKGWKKGMPKTKVEKGGKMEPKRPGPAECACWIPPPPPGARRARFTLQVLTFLKFQP